MALFLKRLTEAVAPETDEDTSVPKDKDAEDEGADAADKADTAADVPEAGDDAAPADVPTDAPPGEGEPPMGGAIGVTTPLYPKPPTSLVEIEDNAQNRLFILEKFQGVIQTHESLLNFLNTVMLKFPNDAKRKAMLDQMLTKIEFNLSMLKRAIDDQIFVGMDIASLFALYKIYFNDASSLLRIIKLVVTFEAVK